MMGNPCVFCDIDGTIMKHLSGDEGDGTLSDYLSKIQRWDYHPFNDVLPGVREKFSQWNKNGVIIVLTTGRPESMRAITAKQLTEAGLFWDHLLMGIGTGPRYLYNDIKPEYPDKPAAHAINLDRNVGFANLKKLP